MKLAVRGLIKLLFGLAAIGLLLFLPAGTFDYWQGWLFIGVLFVPMLLLGVILLVRSPKLLEKRLSAKEKEGEQKRVIDLSALMFVVGFILSAVDVRLGWSELPWWCSYAAAGVFLIGYGLYAETMRENVYLSRTVEVQEGQKVIDTGLYGIVRHPMYFATLLVFLPIPLILGSLYAEIIFLMYPLILIRRIRNEEDVLRRGLAGYEQYMERVKYRLIPFIW